MIQNKILKIIKGLNKFSQDDIVVMTGFDEDKINSVIKKLAKDQVITNLSECEFRYVNKIPERKTALRLVDKPKTQIITNEDIDFKLAAECFFERHAIKTCTPSCLQTYTSITKAHLIPFFGKTKIKDITQNQIKEFIELKQYQKLSNKRIRNCVALFGTMFNKFKDWGLIADSPYNGVINVQISRENNVRVLNKAEVEELLAKCKISSSKLYRIVMLALATGLKRAEIIALKKEDFDFKTKKININKTLWQGELLSPKSNRIIRVVNIPETIIPEFKKAIKKIKGEDFIFFDTSTSFYTQERKLRTAFAKALQELNLGKFNFNDLRHTYAYNVLQQGMSIDYLHKQLGDYSIQLTMDKYRDFIVKS